MARARSWIRGVLVIVGAALVLVTVAVTPGGSVVDGLSKREKAQGDKRWVNVGEEVFGIGQMQVGNDAPSGYQYSLRRYVVEAQPASVGVVVPIPVAITDSFCKDVDGCRITMSMVNWNLAQAGLPATREERLFVSGASDWWRYANNDVEGLDDNDVLNELATFDCGFTDAELYTGVPNGRADSARGFGVLNVAGGAYSDATVTCRAVVED